MIDAAINYRAQRSERSFGRALAELIEKNEIKREEVILCTKGGFIPFDGDYPEDPNLYLRKTYFETGILKPEDVAQDCHAMAPHYLEDQLSRSLKNFGVQTIDIYYLHNPETQLGEVPRHEFLNRMRKAFEWLEQKVKENKIQFYGTATWNGYRVSTEAQDYLSLEELNCIAREVGGPNHHFKAVQVPFNLAMPEAWAVANQSYGANLVPLFQILNHYNMIAIGSAALLQSRLTGPLPDFLSAHFKNLSKSSQRAIQFACSAPGITTALIGMKNKIHVQENLEVAQVPPMSESELVSIFQHR